MKRLIVPLIFLCAGMTLAHGQQNSSTDIRKQNTLSAGGLVLSYFDNSGFYVSAERQVVDFVDLAVRAGFTRSDSIEGTTILCGINWVTSVSDKGRGFVENESYLGFYPLGYSQFVFEEGDGNKTEHYFFPTSVMGYKLLFWDVLVMDMYIGANLAIPLNSTYDELKTGGLLAGIGLGFRF